MAGMTAAMLAESWEKKSVAFLYCCTVQYISSTYISGKLTYLKNTNQIFNDDPVIIIKLVPPEFEGFVGSDGIDCSSICEYEFHHVVRGVPTGYDITRDESFLEIGPMTDLPPSRKSNCSRIDDGKQKLANL